MKVWILNNGRGYFAYRSAFAYYAGDEPLVRAQTWGAFMWSLNELNLRVR